ncbi:MAG: SURF1 family protein [Caldimonas sp.]
MRSGALGTLIATASRRRSGWVLLATVVGVAATLRLGFWQLDRAAQKIAIQTRIDARRTLPVVDAAGLASTADTAAGQHYRRAALRGSWLADRTVFLDNRQMHGVPGFYVVTPLRLEGRSEAVLVQRGWVARSFTDRSALPPIPTPAGPMQIEGLIAPPPSRLYDFAPAASGPIRQNLDLDAYAREARTPLLPLSVLQSESPATAGDGMRREWPLPALDFQKHYGYAFQWFALAALMTGLYVWFQLLRPGRRDD